MTQLSRLLTVAVIAAGLPFAAVAQENAAPTQTGPAVEVDRDVGLPQWERIYAVFSHPRCANCHVEDDRPRWSGPHYGETRVHGFNVMRGSDDSGFGNPGLRCNACHFASNSNVLHGPPGAENWHLAPSEMVWWEKSSSEICAQIKDPVRNGGRTLEEVAIHVRDDGLVGWGWTPGPGREPAPGSAEETFEAIQRWAAAGAPCPED